MMKLKEAAESIFENMGKTTVFSTLDLCEGSKLREVENSCKIIHGFVLIKSPFTDVVKVKECPLNFEKMFRPILRWAGLPIFNSFSSMDDR